MRMTYGRSRERSPSASRQVRRAVNVTLPEPLIQEGKAAGTNLSQACEQGLAVSGARAVAWLQDNRVAPDAWNGHVEAHGILLSEYHQF